eukprot:s1955_g10.t1
MFRGNRMVVSHKRCATDMELQLTHLKCNHQPLRRMWGLPTGASFYRCHFGGNRTPMDFRVAEVVRAWELQVNCLIFIALDTRCNIIL